MTNDDKVRLIAVNLIVCSLHIWHAYHKKLAATAIDDYIHANPTMGPRAVEGVCPDVIYIHGELPDPTFMEALLRRAVVKQAPIFMIRSL